MANYERQEFTRVRRSELSTPGHSEKMIAKAAASDAATTRLFQVTLDRARQFGLIE